MGTENSTGTGTYGGRTGFEPAEPCRNARNREKVYAFVGDAGGTLRAMEKAYEERPGSRSVLSMKLNPVYDFVRDDPRFVSLMQRVGLAP